MSESLTQQPADQEELAQEKRRDYRKTVLLQVLILTSELLFEDAMRLFAWPISVNALKLFFYVISAVYVFFLWDMLRNFTRKRWLTHLVLAALVATFGSLVVLDVILGVSATQATNLRLFCHAGILGVEVLVIALALRDLFQGPRHAVDKLWGSACIYFMSGFAFAGLFFCILLKDPAAFGHQLPENYWGLFESLYLSMNSLVGLDTAYPDSTRLVRNIALLEGAWSQLYMVLLIGRLLSKEEA